jgi:hypothetical protein
MAAVVRPGEEDGQGDAGPDTEHTIGPCGYQWNAGEETTSRGDTVTYSGTLFAPAGSDVRALDRVRFDGRLYEVLGSPSDDTSPFSGWRPPMRVRLRDVEG